MRNIGVVVLNYNSYWETLECIESFMGADCSGFAITFIVVDNGSTNDSAKILRKCLRHYRNVHIEELKANLGFANGNNAGCRLLRRGGNCDYYIISNSDIRVPPDIFGWIDNVFGKYHCDILGPDIYVPETGIHQNPIRRYSSNVAVVNAKILKKKVELFLLKRGLLDGKVASGESSFNQDKKQLRYFDCPVHGSFIISNNRIFDNYEDFFDNRTFLYMEEYLLYLRCKESGLLSMVSLDNQVLHLQGKSTDTTLHNNREKLKNRLIREIESMIVYKNTLKNRT